jgi:hypothetical protein
MIESGVNVSGYAEEPALSWKITGQGRFHVSETFIGYFPANEFANYDDFIKLAGETIKQSARTHVVLTRRNAVDGADMTSCAFIIKCHRYPFLPRLRTGFRISKAENEFNNLHQLRQLGVNAVEPVAYGAERTRLGFVRSCFVITRYLEETITLADWHWANHDKEESMQKAARLIRLGAIFNRLHSARFFLFTAKPRNILLRPSSDSDSGLHILDTPYARTLRWCPLARWAQGRDLGYCLGSFHPNVTSAELESFYQGYLPDTLGGSTTGIQRRIARAIRVQQNLTPMARLVNTLKLYLKQRRRWRRARRVLSR